MIIHEILFILQHDTAQTVNKKIFGLIGVKLGDFERFDIGFKEIVAQHIVRFGEIP